MSLKQVFVATAAIWASLVLIALFARGSFGVDAISWSEYVAWILLAGAPAFLAFLVGRGMSPPRIDQVFDGDRERAAAGHPARKPLPPLSRDRDRS